MFMSFSNDISDCEKGHMATSAKYYGGILAEASDSSSGSVMQVERPS